MTAEEIYKHLSLQEKNLELSRRRIVELETQIENMNNITEVHNTKSLKKSLKDSYTREEIIMAYSRMLIYEGFGENRTDRLITDTFFELLNGTHKSLKPERKRKTK